MVAAALSPDDPEDPVEVDDPDELDAESPEAGVDDEPLDEAAPSLDVDEDSLGRSLAVELDEDFVERLSFL